MDEPLIFIVEDDPIIGNHLHRLLLELGYQIAGPVASGEEAVHRAAQCHPSLILMDITLHGKMDGIQAAEKIRSLLDVPIVFLTAHTDKNTLERAKITDPFGYLIKPFDERGLQTCIEMALNRHHFKDEIKKSESKFQALVENVGEGISIVDSEDVITFANPAAEKIFGVVKGGLVGKSLKEFTSPGDFQMIREQTKQLKLGERSVYEFQITRKDGQVRDLLVTSTPLRDPLTGYLGGFGVLRDITEFIRIQKSERNQRLLAEALREISVALSSTLDVNQVFDMILLHVGKVVPHDTANVMLIEGKKVKIVRAAGYEKFGNAKKFEKMVLDISKTPEFFSMLKRKKTKIIRDAHKKQSCRYLTGVNFIKSCLIAPIMVKGKVVGFLNLESCKMNFFNQVDADRLSAFAYQAAIAIENARLYEQMQSLAITDELTGIYNRRGILGLGEKEFSRAIRFDRSLCLLWIDFDHYKKVNDEFGHEMGDEILKTVVNNCRKRLRHIDSFGRMGGDEFIILLPETDLRGGVVAAEKMRMIAQKTKVPAGKSKAKVTASIGVTAMSMKYNSFSKMLSAADNAMYSAKKAGRNRVRAG
jgi:diguanylate cyclase (GGDEF)-like protein/PAS domain S-box-containing protein